MSYRPFAIVLLSATSYTALARHFQHATKNTFTSPAGSQTLNKAISTAHSSLMTLLVLYALHRSQWRAPPPTRPGPASPKQPSAESGSYLDDSTNLLIVSSSRLANDLSAWEAGYLVYDSYMLLRLAQPASSRSTSAGTALGRLARKSPAILVHHVGLAAALLTLQLYIARGREKGMWIILAFFLMNASSPLMHALWWARKNGRPTRALEIAFAAMFAASRFGVVWYVLHRYGSHHGIGAVQAYLRSRLPCQIGTGALVGLNALWWVTLLRQIVMGRSNGLKDSLKES